MTAGTLTVLIVRAQLGSLIIGACGATPVAPQPVDSARKAEPPTHRSPALEQRVVTLANTPGGPYTYRFAVPVGATESRVDEPGVHFASVTYNFGLGEHSRLLIVADAERACEPLYNVSPWKTLRVETVAGRCAVAAETKPEPGDTATVHVHFEWTDGPLRHSCHVELLEELRATWPAMWRLCEQVSVAPGAVR